MKQYILVSECPTIARISAYSNGYPQKGRFDRDPVETHVG